MKGTWYAIDRNTKSIVKKSNFGMADLLRGIEMKSNLVSFSPKNSVPKIGEMDAVEVTSEMAMKIIRKGK